MESTSNHGRYSNHFLNLLANTLTNHLFNPPPRLIKLKSSSLRSPSWKLKPRSFIQVLQKTINVMKILKEAYHLIIYKIPRVLPKGNNQFFFIKKTLLKYRILVLNSHWIPKRHIIPLPPTNQKNSPQGFI